MNYKRERSAPIKPLMAYKNAESTSMKKQVVANEQKLKGKVQPKCNRDVKCFKCQGLGHYASECANWRVMILRDDGEIMSTSEESDCDDMPPLEDASDLVYVVGDTVSVIRRSLSVQTKEDDVEQQRENIFHTRCLIKLRRFFFHSLNLNIIIVCILPFEIVYGFNPLTPLDLIPLLVDERVSLDGNKKTQVVKDLHAKIWQQIEKKNEQYANKANRR